MTVSGHSLRPSHQIMLFESLHEPDSVSAKLAIDVNDGPARSIAKSKSLGLRRLALKFQPFYESAWACFASLSQEDHQLGLGRQPRQPRLASRGARALDRGGPRTWTDGSDNLPCRRLGARAPKRQHSHCARE